MPLDVEEPSILGQFDKGSTMESSFTEKKIQRPATELATPFFELPQTSFRLPTLSDNMIRIPPLSEYKSSTQLTAIDSAPKRSIINLSFKVSEEEKGDELQQKDPFLNPVKGSSRSRNDINSKVETTEALQRPQSILKVAKAVVSKISPILTYKTPQNKPEDKEDIFEFASEEDLSKSSDVEALMSAAKVAGEQKMRKVSTLGIRPKTATVTSNVKGDSSIKAIKDYTGHHETKLSAYEQLLRAVQNGERDKVAEVLLKFCGPPPKGPTMAPVPTVASESAQGKGAEALPRIHGGPLVSPGTPTLTEIEEKENKTVYEARDHTNRTFLMMASQAGKYSIAKILLQYHCNINAMTESGKTALVYAICAGNLEVADLLLQNGANPNTIDKGEGTPLLSAITCPYPVSTVKLLLQFGANPQYRDSRGVTALSRICTSYTRDGNTRKEMSMAVELAQLLISRGAPFIAYVSPKQPMTHLMMATLSGNFSLVRFFVEKMSAPVLETTQHGHRAITFAKANKYMDIAEYLESHKPLG